MSQRDLLTKKKVGKKDENKDCLFWGKVLIWNLFRVD